MGLRMLEIIILKQISMKFLFQKVAVFCSAMAVVNRKK